MDNSELLIVHAADAHKELFPLRKIFSECEGYYINRNKIVFRELSGRFESISETLVGKSNFYIFTSISGAADGPLGPPFLTRNRLLRELHYNSEWGEFLKAADLEPEPAQNVSASDFVGKFVVGCCSEGEKMEVLPGACLLLKAQERINEQALINPNKTYFLLEVKSSAKQVAGVVWS